MKISTLKFAILSLVVGLSVATSKAGTQEGLLSGFGFMNDWTVFEVGPGNVQVNNGSSITGNFGIGNAQQVQINNGATITGKLVLGSTSIPLQVQNGATITGGTSYKNLSADVTAANNASTFFAGLAPTANYGSQINLNGTSLTISSTASTNVIDLQNLNVNNGGVLTLSGNASSKFVFDITGALNVNNGSAIKLTGGLNAGNVVFNLIGTGNGDVLNNNSMLEGTVVATQRNVSINNGSNTIVGAVISEGLQLNNNSKIVSAEF